MEIETFRHMTPDAKMEYVFSMVERLEKECTSLRRDINAIHRTLRMGPPGARSKKKKRRSQPSAGEAESAS